jgi:hypothetical protein
VSTGNDLVQQNIQCSRKRKNDASADNRLSADNIVLSPDYSACYQLVTFVFSADNTMLSTDDTLVSADNMVISADTMESSVANMLSADTFSVFLFLENFTQSNIMQKIIFFIIQ